MKREFEDIIKSLKKSITPADYFVDYPKVYVNVKDYEIHLNILNTLIGKDDIEKEFGKKVRDYVYDASEPDKSLEWEDRKKHTIEHIKDAPLGSKLIVACDKITNLESISDCIELYGEEKEYGSLKRGKDKQKWYYTSVYESCINGVDENHPIFKRYRDVLEMVFNY